jgi:DNA polymerase-3 subunit epsilon
MALVAARTSLAARRELPDMPAADIARPLSRLDVVVVDVETTGLRPDDCSLIEIGAVRLRGAAVTGEFFTLVSPPVPVPPDITELTGITDDMVRPAPGPGPALTAFLAFARGAVLAAHNARFDIGFLTAGCRATGVTWPRPAVLDTAVLARLLLGQDEVPDCKLATLAAFFGTGSSPNHRALADAQATAEVLTGLLRLAGAGHSLPRRAPQLAAPPPRALVALPA